MQKFVRNAISLSIFWFLFGCASMVTPLEAEKVQLSKNSENHIVRILKKDFQGKDIEKKTIEAIAMSNFQKGGIFKFGDFSKCAGTTSCGRLYIQGINAKISESGIEVSYYNGERFPDTRTVHVSEIKTTIPLAIEEENKYYKITFGSPDSITKTQGKNVFGFPIKFFDQTANIELDIKSRLDNMKKISVSRNYLFTQEFNSVYNSESIYANFERILGKYSWKANEVSKDDIEKKNSFAFIFKEEKLPLLVSVYPYRGGSKILCKLHLPYSISESYSISEADLDPIRKKLKEIVND